jgi:hypothetical protein
VNRVGLPAAGFALDGVENLSYNNPLELTVERVGFAGSITYAVDQRQGDLDVARRSIPYSSISVPSLCASGRREGYKPSPTGV